MIVNFECLQIVSALSHQFENHLEYWRSGWLKYFIGLCSTLRKHNERGAKLLAGLVLVVELCDVFGDSLCNKRLENLRTSINMKKRSTHTILDLFSSSSRASMASWNWSFYSSQDKPYEISKNTSIRVLVCSKHLSMSSFRTLTSSKCLCFVSIFVCKSINERNKK